MHMLIWGVMGIGYTLLDLACGIGQCVNSDFVRHGGWLIFLDCLLQIISQST